MKNNIQIVLFFLTCLTITSCTKDEKNNAKNEQVSEISDLKKRIEELESSVFADNSSILDLTDDGYSTKDCVIGTLAFKLKDIKSFGSATKVYLEIGNPTYAEITGFNLGLSLINESEEKKSKMFKITKHLKKGAWTTVDFIFEKTDPSKVKNVKIYYSHCTSISLYKN